MSKNPSANYCHRLRRVYVTVYGKSPAYGICALFAQCAFLVAQLEICRSPGFVIYMSSNPSSNCCRLLRRLVVLYEGEISLHFDPPMSVSDKTRHMGSTRYLRNVHFSTSSQKNVKVDFLLYSCQRTFLLTFAIVYGG